MKFRLVLAVGGMLGLVGCDAITGFQLSVAQQELRQECFGNFTNTCVSKTIDFNIKVLESIPLSGPNDKTDIIAMFGDKGWDFWEESEQEVKDQVIEVLESRRPGWFSRWFLGDAQPFDERGVIAFSQGDLEPLQERAKEVFVGKLKAAGMKPAEQEAANNAGEQQSSQMKESLITEAHTDQPDHQMVEASPQPQLLQPPAGIPPLTLSAAIDRLVEDEIASDGGSEYQEGRKAVQVDLNGDGAEDAVVLYTIEGQGGGNSSFQTLAAFYKESGGWVVKQKVVVGGATDLQVLGQNIFGLKVLTHGDDDPRCCPSIESTVKYKWTGTSFAELTGAGQNAG
ncbi:hypothetical protein [Pseudomonas aeruginosa]|uniref:hypothetical protein n=1 Tax=Pseudomonas aeruginosa TaxID=287 RepID=UPI00053E0083|nr:hypothetical protein [Pseudomonas aeruginosa]